MEIELGQIAPGAAHPAGDPPLSTCKTQSKHKTGTPIGLLVEGLSQTLLDYSQIVTNSVTALPTSNSMEFSHITTN